MKEWIDGGVAPPVVAINLSTLRFKTPLELENDINDVLAATGLPPDRLELELAESVLMDPFCEHTEVQLRLHKQGLRIAIDDFGTGYSSLDYLRHFPVDRIKVVQNFIPGLTGTSGNAAIVRTAICLAHELNLKVVAEGAKPSSISISSPPRDAARFRATTSRSH